MSNVVASSCASNAHDMTSHVSLSIAEGQTAVLGEMVKPKKKRIPQGDFIDSAKAKEDLCNHLRKLLAYFEKPESVVEDPGSFGYVSQTFRMLLEDNPVYLPAAKSRQDPECMPCHQFMIFQCEGSWSDLDNEIGFDRKRIEAFEKSEDAKSKYLMKIEQAKWARILPKETENFKTFYVQITDGQLSDPLSGNKAKAIGENMPDSQFIEIVASAKSNTYHDGRVSWFGYARSNRLNGSEIVASVEKHSAESEVES